jgi:hypothetical protein
MLAMPLVNKSNSEIQMKCLFVVCDSDRNGYLSKAEVVDILVIFMIVREGKGNDGSEKFKGFVDKVFSDKTQFSLDECDQICAANEELAFVDR